MTPGRQRGFALLAVLWTVTALTVLAGVSVTVARLGSETTRNRLLLARAGWAREACAEILLARYAQDLSVRVLDTTDLGRGTWCRAGLEDEGGKLNVNLATPDALRAVLRAQVRDSLAADSVVERIVQRRRQVPLVDLRELALLPGLDSSLVADLVAVLTARGPGTIDVNAASSPVLATLPGMTDEAVAVITERRSSGRPVTTPDELAQLVSPNARAALYGAYPDFARAATFSPRAFVGVVEGGIRRSPLTARLTMTLVPTTGRLAVIRRETE